MSPHTNANRPMSRWLIDIEADRTPGDIIQTTREEVDTFRLSPFLVDDLAGAYERYLNYLGAFSPPIDTERRSADRRDYPGYGYSILAASPILVSELVVRFMVDVCGLSGGQSTRFDLMLDHAVDDFQPTGAWRRDIRFTINRHH